MPFKLIYVQFIIEIYSIQNIKLMHHQLLDMQSQSAPNGFNPNLDERLKIKMFGCKKSVPAYQLSVERQSGGGKAPKKQNFMESQMEGKDYPLCESFLKKEKNKMIGTKKAVNAKIYFSSKTEERQPFSKREKFKVFGCRKAINANFYNTQQLDFVFKNNSSSLSQDKYKRIGCQKLISPSIYNFNKNQFKQSKQSFKGGKFKRLGSRNPLSASVFYSKQHASADNFYPAKEKVKKIGSIKKAKALFYNTERAALSEQKPYKQPSVKEKKKLIGAIKSIKPKIYYDTEMNFFVRSQKQIKKQKVKTIGSLKPINAIKYEFGQINKNKNSVFHQEESICIEKNRQKQEEQKVKNKIEEKVQINNSNKEERQQEIVEKPQQSVKQKEIGEDNDYLVYPVINIHQISSENDQIQEEEHQVQNEKLEHIQEQINDEPSESSKKEDKQQQKDAKIEVKDENEGKQQNNFVLSLFFGGPTNAEQKNQTKQKENQEQTQKEQKIIEQKQKEQIKEIETKREKVQQKRDEKINQKVEEKKQIEQQNQNEKQVNEKKIQKKLKQKELQEKQIEKELKQKQIKEQLKQKAIEKEEKKEKVKTEEQQRMQKEQSKIKGQSEEKQMIQQKVVEKQEQNVQRKQEVVEKEKQVSIKFSQTKLQPLDSIQIGRNEQQMNEDQNQNNLLNFNEQEKIQNENDDDQEIEREEENSEQGEIQLDEKSQSSGDQGVEDDEQTENRQPFQQRNVLKLQKIQQKGKTIVISQGQFITSRKQIDKENVVRNEKGYTSNEERILNKTVERKNIRVYTKISKKKAKENENKRQKQNLPKIKMRLSKPKHQKEEIKDSTEDKTVKNVAQRNEKLRNQLIIKVGKNKKKIISPYLVQSSSQPKHKKKKNGQLQPLQEFDLNKNYVKRESPTTKHKFLKAHSHQFSYLYPTESNENENNKLKSKIQELSQKLQKNCGNSRQSHENRKENVSQT